LQEYYRVIPHADGEINQDNDTTKHLVESRTGLLHCSAQASSCLNTYANIQQLRECFATRWNTAVWSNRHANVEISACTVAWVSRGALRGIHCCCTRLSLVTRDCPLYAATAG